MGKGFKDNGKQAGSGVFETMSAETLLTKINV